MSRQALCKAVNLADQLAKVKAFFSRDIEKAIPKDRNGTNWQFDLKLNLYSCCQLKTTNLAVIIMKIWTWKLSTGSQHDRNN